MAGEAVAIMNALPLAEIVRAFAEIVGGVLRTFSTPPAAPPTHITDTVAPILKEAPEVIIREAQKHMGIDCWKHYNFVVCGQSGVGKSSFINAVLSLEGNDRARVGETETTHQRTMFSSGRLSSLKLWDIPGAATIDHPAPSYFEDNYLYAFDGVLILSCDRFLQVDFDILQKAEKYGTPCVFVRTKCDIAVANRARRDNIDAHRASVLLRQDVKGSFEEGLQKYGIRVAGSSSAPPLFFVCSESFFFASGSYDIYDRTNRSLDTSLSTMDEQPLLTYLEDQARRRLY